MTRYRTIVCDPPWHYDRFVGRTIGGGDGWEARELPYPSMTLAEIAELPVSMLGGLDCRLFCWATNRYLPDAFTIVRGWGFDYQQTLVWHKTNASPYPGAVAPLDLEYVIVAQRGRPGRIGTGSSSLIEAGIKRQHSAKPDALQDLVEQISPGPYLEMFSRRARLGWDTHGDESLNHVELAGGPA